MISNHLLGPTIHIKACDMKARTTGEAAGEHPCGSEGLTGSSCSVNQFLLVQFPCVFPVMSMCM